MAELSLDIAIYLAITTVCAGMLFYIGFRNQIARKLYPIGNYLVLCGIAELTGKIIANLGVGNAVVVPFYSAIEFIILFYFFHSSILNKTISKFFWFIGILGIVLVFMDYFYFADNADINVHTKLVINVLVIGGVVFSFFQSFSRDQPLEKYMSIALSGILIMFSGSAFIFFMRGFIVGFEIDTQFWIYTASALTNFIGYLLMTWALYISSKYYKRRLIIKK